MNVQATHAHHFWCCFPEIIKQNIRNEWLLLFFFFFFYFLGKQNMQTKSPVHRMIAHIVMAKSTCKQLATTSSTQFAVSFVMLTPKHSFLRISEWWWAFHIFTIRSFPSYWFWQLLLGCYPTTKNEPRSNNNQWFVTKRWSTLRFHELVIYIRLKINKTYLKISK